MPAISCRSRALETEWGSRDLDAVRLDLENAQARLKEIDGEVDQAVLKEKEGRDALKAFVDEAEVNRAIVERESATAEMHAALERYLELSLASDLLGEAMAEVRAEQQDPLIARAGVLFAAMTEGEFVGIETDVDEKGAPVVKGKRANGETESVAKMSDGTRDQLFLAFRLASLESYGESAEPLPFIADDILVHFDDDRAQGDARSVSPSFGKRNQVLLFTHRGERSRRGEPNLRKRAGRTSSISPRRRDLLRAPVRPVRYAARQLWFVTLRRRPRSGGAWKDELGAPVPGQQVGEFGLRRCSTCTCGHLEEPDEGFPTGEHVVDRFGDRGADARACGGGAEARPVLRRRRRAPSPATVLGALGAHRRANAMIVQMGTNPLSEAFAAGTRVIPAVTWGRRGGQDWAGHMPSSIAWERQRSAHLSDRPPPT